MGGEKEIRWGFLTNHALALVYVALHPDSTVREVARDIGLTERATLAILHALEDEGLLTRHRHGRRNAYSVDLGALAEYRRGGLPENVPASFVQGLVAVLLRLTGQSDVPPPKAHPARWGSVGLLTSHALILQYLARNPDATIREIGDAVGLTERAASSVLLALREEGIIAQTREGRRNRYAINHHVLRAFSRWSPGPWPLPTELSEMAIAGLQALAAGAARAADDAARDVPGEPGEAARVTHLHAGRRGA